MRLTLKSRYPFGVLRLTTLALLLFLALYATRLYWVESKREYSQSGVLRVLFDTVPEIREKKIDIWANGIGCDYWRLQHCLGIELGNVASTIPNLAERFSDIVNNFCAIVEKKYARESYTPVLGQRTHEIYLDLSQAYSIYFDCKNSRKPIGKVRLYISNEAKTINEPKKAQLIANI